jgi:uncharacterized protein
MNAFFFGESARPLFGVHHEPIGLDRGAVVLCPGWGREYQYAHRTYGVLARRLTEAGWHVLRFDYTGEGDSWGDTTYATLPRWIADVRTAVEEIRSLTGHQEVSLLGMRIGAYVAAQVAESTLDVPQLILWDPVLDGPSWVRELAGRTGIPSSEATPIELAGRCISPELLHGFLEVSIASYGNPPVSRALQLVTTDPTVVATLPLNYIERRDLADVSPWIEDASIWSGLVPTQAIRAIVEWMEDA